jgi:hypothetical protein
MIMGREDMNHERVLQSYLSSVEVPGAPEATLGCLGTRLWCVKMKENYLFRFTQKLDEKVDVIIA